MNYSYRRGIAALLSLAAALVQEIDTTLQAMIDDGTVSALSQQFLGEDVLAAGTAAAG